MRRFTRYCTLILLAYGVILPGTISAQTVSKQPSTVAAPTTPSAVSAPVAPPSAVAVPAAAQSAAAAMPTGNEHATNLDAAKFHLDREYSPWSMFLGADILVKAVMVGLALASLATWTIFFAKTVQIARAQKRIRDALADISEMRTLSEAQLAVGTENAVLSAFLEAAFHEVGLSGNDASEAGIKERAASRFAEISRAEARAMRHGMAILATIGATSPFVGLFGTVWGIMNSFIGISKAQTTNLAVVAPGIAEALMATAIGLVAAIPAVIIYNHFSRVIKSYLELVNRGSGEVGRLLSRDLDRTHESLFTRAAE
jgi:biopolymer transport protein ExbB